MAATSFCMQSVFASALRSGGSPARQLFYTTGVPPLKRSAIVGVRCRAEGGKSQEEPKTSPSPSPSKPKVSTKFTDVLAFSGPGPERINGRLAMIGFVAALGVELASGEDLVAQISGGGIPWFLATSAVLTLASLVPLFKGVRAESKSDGIMTADAELWNGRLAMLGLVALAFTEYVKGGTLV